MYRATLPFRSASADRKGSASTVFEVARQLYQFAPVIRDHTTAHYDHYERCAAIVCKALLHSCEEVGSIS